MSEGAIRIGARPAGPVRLGRNPGSGDRQDQHQKKRSARPGLCDRTVVHPLVEPQRGMEVERQLAPTQRRQLARLTTLGRQAAHAYNQYTGENLDANASIAQRL